MSSEASQDAICKAFAVGAVDYLVKPIRRNEVVTLWQHVWRNAANSIAAGGCPLFGRLGVHVWMRAVVHVDQMDDHSTEMQASGKGPVSMV
jgi:DNA-binding response OmpR family regulator